MLILLGVTFDPEISRIIAEAKTRGHTIEVRHGKVMVCGSSAAGKSNFINLLLGDKFVRTHEATVVTEAKDTMVKEIMVSEHNKDLVEFKKCDIKHQIKILKSHLYYKQYETGTSDTSDVKPLSESVQSTVRKASDQKTSKSVATPSSSETSTHREPKKPGSSNTTSTTLDVIKDKPAYEKYEGSDIVNNLSEVSKDIEKLPKTWDMMTFLDTGGQPEYISMLPAINSSVMVTFVVLSLEYDLSQKVTVFKGDDVKDNRTYPLPYDYKSLIKMLLSMRKPQIVKVPVEVLAKEGKRKSYISFIGTKTDIVTNKLHKNLNDVVDKIDKELQSIIEEVFCGPDTLKFVSGKLLTAVSNCNAGNVNDEDKKAKIVRSKLYKKLQDTADVYHIPIPWLLLELEIKHWCEKNSRHCMKLQEIKHLCAQHGLLNNDEEYIKKFLKFYHILGVFLYYDIDGHDIVVINVQWFFNNLSKLVTFATTSEDRDDYEHLLKKGLGKW